MPDIENAGWDKDPLLRLSQLRKAGDFVSWETEKAVLACRKRGLSWEQIAKALGVTRQSAHRKYAQL